MPNLTEEVSASQAEMLPRQGTTGKVPATAVVYSEIAKAAAL